MGAKCQSQHGAARMAQGRASTLHIQLEVQPAMSTLLCGTPAPASTALGLLWRMEQRRSLLRGRSGSDIQLLLQLVFCQHNLLLLRRSVDWAQQHWSSCTKPGSGEWKPMPPFVDGQAAPSFSDGWQ
jgi:hypothetical protein